jgi:2-enoate reductase
VQTDGTTDNVLTVVQVLNGMEPQGERILVMGGGVIGCETALYLARQGRQVSISTRRDADALAADLFDENNRDMLLMMIKDAGITVLSDTVPVWLEGGHVVADQNGIEKKIPMDSLVFSGRLFPQNELSASFEGKSNVFSVGDCVEPGRIMDAVWGGFTTVREIEK